MFSHSDDKKIDRLCRKSREEGLSDDELLTLFTLLIRYRKEAKKQIAMARGF